MIWRMSAASLSVILATFNGALHLRQQLMSLACQLTLPTELIVGDDGSQDETSFIVQEFAKISPFAVRWIPPCNERLGACANFLRLLEYACGDYLLFCDQDDVWLPDKISITLEEIQRIEVLHGKNIPCLVHTDLSIIDSDSTLIKRSFWKYQHLDPSLCLKLNAALVQNVVTGCTIIVNRALLDVVLPLPLSRPLMHDWWFLLVALAIGGKVSYIARPTVLYRQHGQNVVGAKEWRIANVLKKMWVHHRIQDQIYATQVQAATLLQRHRNQLSEINQSLVEDYASLASHGFFARRMCLLRHNICKSGWQRTLGLYVYV